MDQVGIIFNSIAVGLCTQFFGWAGLIGSVSGLIVYFYFFG